VVSVELEASKKPTLHLALPWYYKMIQHCEAASSDSDEMAFVKSRALSLLQNKFLLEPLHQVAAVLNPKMKTLRMLPEDKKQHIYNALQSMMSLLPLQQPTECKLQLCKSLFCLPSCMLSASDVITANTVSNVFILLELFAVEVGYNTL